MDLERYKKMIACLPLATPDAGIPETQTAMRWMVKQLEAAIAENAALRERCRVLREGMDSAYQSLLSAATYDQDDRPEEFIPYSSYDWRRRSMKQESIARDGALAAGSILLTDAANAMEES